MLERYRTAVKDIIKQVGRSIFTGRFNLGSVSFPIKCMSPESILPIIATMSIHSPIYLTAAGLTDDPLLRMKYVITNALSYYYPCHIFDKPLNPILGETYQGRLADGAQVYMEQVCHHPPISYLLQTGPDDLYKWSGYSTFVSRVYMNSIDLDVTGTKVLEFKSDGAQIKYNGPNDNFANFLWGTLIHNLTGTCNFVDEKNGIEAYYTFGEAGRKYPKDYFAGEIKKDGVVVSKIFGSFMGYVDFDGVRFWDGRRMQNFEILPVEPRNLMTLESDSR